MMNLPFVGRHIASLLPSFTVVIRSHLHRGTPLRSISSSVTSPRQNSTSDDHRLLPSSLIPTPQPPPRRLDSKLLRSEYTGVKPEILKSVGKAIPLIPENFNPPHGDQGSQPPPIETRSKFDFGEKDLVSEESLWSLYKRWVCHWKDYRCVPRNLNKEGMEFDTFKKNAKYVHEFNKKGKLFKLALNMFAAMTCQEFKSIYCKPACMSRSYWGYATNRDKTPRGTCMSAGRTPRGTCKSA